jgi:hypothetical protein
MTSAPAERIRLTIPRDLVVYRAASSHTMTTSTPRRTFSASTSESRRLVSSLISENVTRWTVRVASSMSCQRRSYDCPPRGMKVTALPSVTAVRVSRSVVAPKMSPEGSPVSSGSSMRRWTIPCWKRRPTVSPGP